MSMRDAPAATEQLSVGDRVRILDGPFQHFEGDILEVNEETRHVIVGIVFFERETAVELKPSQVVRAE